MPGPARRYLRRADTEPPSRSRRPNERSQPAITPIRHVSGLSPGAPRAGGDSLEGFLMLGGCGRLGCWDRPERAHCMVDGRRAFLSEGPAWAKSSRAVAWERLGGWQGLFLRVWAWWGMWGPGLVCRSPLTPTAMVCPWHRLFDDHQRHQLPVPSLPQRPPPNVEMRTVLSTLSTASQPSDPSRNTSTPSDPRQLTRPAAGHKGKKAGFGPIRG